jgi:hypothetical protein
MADRFPDYDVLTKRDTPSWNPQTRAVIDERLALTPRDDVLTADARATLAYVIDRIVPQPEDRPQTNALALVLDKFARDSRDGFRHHALPPLREAWDQGLAAIDAEAEARFAARFVHLDGGQADAVLSAIECDETIADWPFPPHVFWKWRLLPDVVAAYYAHPSAWSAMGFGGPASPRGYVRLDADRRDPWEAAERDDGHLVPAEVHNRHVG